MDCDARLALGGYLITRHSPELPRRRRVKEQRQVCSVPAHTAHLLGNAIEVGERSTPFFSYVESNEPTAIAPSMFAAIVLRDHRAEFRLAIDRKAERNRRIEHGFGTPLGDDIFCLFSTRRAGLALFCFFDVLTDRALVILRARALRMTRCDKIAAPTPAARSICPEQLFRKLPEWLLGAPF